MIRIGPASLAALGWIVFSAFFAVLLPSAAQAACSQWDASGQWGLRQTNGFGVDFTLQQTETGLQGSARWYNYNPGADPPYSGDGSVDGTINGDSLDVTAYWGGGDIGRYTGHIGPTGRATGTTVDQMDPRSVAGWNSQETFKCLTTAGGTSAGGVSPKSIAPPVDGGVSAPPVKSIGRVGPSTTGPTTVPGICNAAKVARARNSPAAPGLEAQCSAALSQGTTIIQQ